MNRSHLLLPTALAAALMLVACGRNDNQTAGQKADQPVASAKAGNQDAADKLAASATDATITTKIKAALVADDQLKAISIDVDTKDGHVLLSGTAPDEVSRNRATTLAKAVDGVVAVDNKLAIRPKS